MAVKKKKTASASASASAPAPAFVAQTFGSPLRSLVIDERVFATVVAVGVFAFFVWQVRDVLVPLMFVGVFTFLGAPVVAMLEKRGVPRAAGAGIFLVAVIGFVAALVALVAPPLVHDIFLLAEQAPAALHRATELIEKHSSFVVPTSLEELSSTASKELVDQLSPFAAKGGALVSAGALSLAKGAASAAGFVGKLLLVPIIAFFLLAEWPEVKAIAAHLAPVRARGVGSRYLPLVDDALSGLIRGQLTVAAVMSVVYVVCLGVAGVPLAVGIGILAGAAYLIPFASASTALVLSIAFALLEKGDEAGGPILGAVVTCVIVQILEGYVLTPRIVGEKAGLSPLAALLAVLLGGSAAGFLGVLFALPVGAVIALILREEFGSGRDSAVAIPQTAEAR